MILSRELLSGLLIPFIGTAAGAACVFFLKNDLKISVQKALTGSGSCREREICPM